MNLFEYRLSGVVPTECDIAPGDLKGTRSAAVCVSRNYFLRGNRESYTSREKSSKHQAVGI